VLLYFTKTFPFAFHCTCPGKSQLQLQFSEQNKGKTSKEAAPAQSSFSEGGGEVEVEVQKKWGSETRSFMIAGEITSDVCAIQQERFEIKPKTKIDFGFLLFLYYVLLIGHPTIKFKMLFNFLII